jgi:hypothetical protein
VSVINLALQPAGGSGANALITLRHFGAFEEVITEIGQWGPL